MEPPKTTDLEKVRNGDPLALRQWFDVHVDKVYGFIYYRVGNDPQAASDVTQATFERALERLGDFDPARGSMATWLRITSRNLIRDHLKISNRNVPLEQLWARLDSVLESHLSEIDDQLLPDEALERDETRELVSMTLANLPENYRDMLDAKYLDEQSLETIAAARGTTTDAVKSMLRRARAAFRATFQTLSDPELPSRR
jgi:RNA polymerase sigma-70 factor (ECF subfamily)